MRGVLATMGRELRSYFWSPLGWLILTGFLTFEGFQFQLIVDHLNNPQAPALTPLGFFFGGTILYWVTVLFVTPVLTMRLLSEERKTGTLEALLTAPITEAQVVLGKYLGALVFYMLLWAPTLIYVLLLSRHLEIDWGPVLASYVGTFGLGALFLAIGTMVSALTRNQVVAAIGTFAILFLLFLAGFMEGLINDPALKQVLEYVNLFQHMDEFGKGIVDTRRLVYYLSTSAFCLFLASRALEANKGR